MSALPVVARANFESMATPVRDNEVKFVRVQNSTAILSFRDPDRTGPLCLLAVLRAWLNDIRGNHMAKKRKAKKTKRKRTAKRRKRSTRILGVPIPTLGKG